MRFKELQTRRSLIAVASRGAQAGYGTHPGYQQCAAATTDGSVVFRIVSQPEHHHRARYQTEGSRGAVKDRAGTGYPTVQIDGYKKPTKIQIFIGNESGKVLPHMFYQVCKVTGKNSNPCDEKRVDGTDVIELTAKPANNMRLICDCVGILKERYTDIEARFPKQTSWKNAKKKSTKCRMVFRAFVENKSGQSETLQVVSDVINCSQLPGTPEILKMSSDSSPVGGGGELWMIGKNFLKDTQVIFTYSIFNKDEPLWIKVVEPCQNFFHQSHLIAKIPAFFDASFYGDTVISVHIRCGDKVSDPVPFTYKANPIQFTFAPSDSHNSSANLTPNDESTQDRITKTKHFKSESVSVIKANHSVCKKAKPTILEPLEIRRTRFVSGPSLVSENAILVSDTSRDKHTLTTFPSTAFLHSGSKEDSDDQHDMHSSLHLDTDVGNEEQLLSFYEEATNSNLTKDSLLDENSFLSTRTDPIRSNAAFSNGFDFKWNDEVTNNECDKLQETNDEILANCINDFKEKEKDNIPNISYEATTEEKAVISISLPTSILKDQKHFQSVMDTINNALIKQDVPEKEDLTKIGANHPNTQTEKVNDNCIQLQSSSSTMMCPESEQVTKESVENTSSNHSNSSVLTKTRKRNFTEEYKINSSSKESSFQYAQIISSESQWKSVFPNHELNSPWKSEINDILEASQAVHEDKSTNVAEQVNAMDWSNNKDTKAIKEAIIADCSKPMAAFLAEPVTATEVKEAFDMIETLQKDVGGMEKINLSTDNIMNQL